MPPKVKITREDVVSAALGIARREGYDAVNARRIASVLACSTQPIFSNFSSMDALRNAMIQTAERLFSSYLDQAIAEGSYVPYKASGMAYIRFAADEPALFKLLFMRDRTGEAATDEPSDLTLRMRAVIQKNTGLSDADADRFHCEMWAFVHGFAVMIATHYLTLPWELISDMLTDAYQGLLSRYQADITERK